MPISKAVRERMSARTAQLAQNARKAEERRAQAPVSPPQRKPK